MANGSALKDHKEEVDNTVDNDDRENPVNDIFVFALLEKSEKKSTNG